MRLLAGKRWIIFPELYCPTNLVLIYFWKKNHGVRSSCENGEKENSRGISHVQWDVPPTERLRLGILPNFNVCPLWLCCRDIRINRTTRILVLLHYSLFVVYYAASKSWSLLEQIFHQQKTNFSERFIWWTIYIYFSMDISVRYGSCVLKFPLYTWAGAISSLCIFVYINMKTIKKLCVINFYLILIIQHKRSLKGIGYFN